MTASVRPRPQPRFKFAIFPFGAEEEPAGSWHLHSFSVVPRPSPQPPRLESITLRPCLGSWRFLGASLPPESNGLARVSKPPIPRPLLPPRFNSSDSTSLILLAVLLCILAIAIAHNQLLLSCSLYTLQHRLNPPLGRVSQLVRAYSYGIQYSPCLFATLSLAALA